MINNSKAIKKYELCKSHESLTEHNQDAMLLWDINHLKDNFIGRKVLMTPTELSNLSELNPNLKPYLEDDAIKQVILENVNKDGTVHKIGIMKLSYDPSLREAFKEEGLPLDLLQKAEKTRDMIFKTVNECSPSYPIIMHEEGPFVIKPKSQSESELEPVELSFLDYIFPNELELPDLFFQLPFNLLGLVMCLLVFLKIAITNSVYFKTIPDQVYCNVLAFLKYLKKHLTGRAK